MGERAPVRAGTINPLEPGLAWVRGMDMLPVLTSEREITATEEELIRRRARLSPPRAAAA